MITFALPKVVAVVVFSCLLIACEDEVSPSKLANDNGRNSTPLKHRELAIKDYDTARPMLWRSVYPNGGKTLYCNEAFDSDRRKGYNVEHVFPMSWATNGLNCGKRKQCRARSDAFNQIEADLHNLFPSRSDVNQDRSSFRFGEVKGESRRYGRKCDFEVNERARVAEPSAEKRGEVARAMFYMADQYKAQGLVLFKKQALLLEQWHKADPPSDEEHRRNNVIEKLQGNRNQFIDDPERVHRLIKSRHFFN